MNQFQEMINFHNDLLELTPRVNRNRAHFTLLLNAKRVSPKNLLIDTLGILGFSLELVYYVANDGKVMCTATIMNAGIFPLFTVSSQVELDYRVAAHGAVLSTILKLSLVLRCLYFSIPPTMQYFKVIGLNLGNHANRNAVDLRGLFGPNVLSPILFGIPPVIKMPPEYLERVLIPLPPQSPIYLTPGVPLGELQVSGSQTAHFSVPWEPVGLLPGQDADVVGLPHVGPYEYTWKQMLAMYPQPTPLTHMSVSLSPEDQLTHMRY